MRPHPWLPCRRTGSSPCHAGAATAAARAHWPPRSQASPVAARAQPSAAAPAVGRQPPTHEDASMGSEGRGTMAACSGRTEGGREGVFLHGGCGNVGVGNDS
jgi:hypothetical protein